jgi:fumarate hydratase class I
MVEFKYEKMFSLGKDTTEYRPLTKDYLKVRELEGNSYIKFVSPKFLAYFA